MLLLDVAEYELEENNCPHFRAKAGSLLCVNARIGRSKRTPNAATGMKRKQYAPRITTWAMTTFVNTSTRRSKSRMRDDSCSLMSSTLGFIIVGGVDTAIRLRMTQGGKAWTAGRLPHTKCPYCTRQAA